MKIAQATTASANGATGKRWPELAHRAARLGLTGETFFSERPGHLIELARAAVDNGATRVVAVGGDGTLNEVVNGIAGRDVDLATVPLGTGMDFVRTYGIPTTFDDAVVRNGQTVFETGTINGIRFRFSEPTAFTGTFSTNARLTYRILGATEVSGADALLLEPVRLEPAR